LRASPRTRFPISPARSDAAAARRLDAGALYLQAGDPAKAASLATGLCDTADAALRARARHLLALVRFREERFEEAAALLYEAARDAVDPEQRAAIELDLALAGISASFDHEPARAHAAIAVEQASRGKDTGLLASTLAVEALTDFLIGDGVDETQLARALQLEEDGRGRIEMRPTLIAGFLGFYTGRVDVAYSLLYPLREAMRERGEQAELPLLDIHLAWLECLIGNVPQARRLCDEAVELATLSHTMEAHAHAFAALLEAHVGDVDACRAQVLAAETASAAADYCLVIQWIAIATGLLEVSLGNMAEADRALEPITAYFEGRETVEPIHLSLLPDKIEALVGLGMLDRAERLTDLLVASGEHFQRPATLAAAARSRAIVLAGRRDLVGAQDAIAIALAHHEAAPLPLELARTLIVKGQLERRRKQRGAAAASLGQALAICEQVGAARWAEQARAELARTGTVRGNDELTPSETRVAELAATGLTNREIAATAFMSQKTVEANLSRVYRKLGIRSRAELGVRLAGKAAD
jgi:DNA-binding CsgD family transcriptional regulator